LGVWIVV
jgi:hypothetical protein